MSIILIHPYPGRPEADVRLSGILSHALADREGRTIRTAEELDLRPGDRVLFALALDGAGQNLEYYRMLSRLRREPDLLEGCTAALIVDGPGRAVHQIHRRRAGPSRRYWRDAPSSGGRWWRGRAPWPTSASRPKTWAPT